MIAWLRDQFTIFGVLAFALLLIVITFGWLILWTIGRFA